MALTPEQRDQRAYDLRVAISALRMDMHWASGKLNLMDPDSTGSIINESGDLITSLGFALQSAKKLKELAQQHRKQELANPRSRGRRTHLPYSTDY
jgi:hypothetical protein